MKQPRSLSLVEKMIFCPRRSCETQTSKQEFFAWTIHEGQILMMIGIQGRMVSKVT